MNPYTVQTICITTDNINTFTELITEGIMTQNNHALSPVAYLDFSRTKRSSND